MRTSFALCVCCLVASFARPARAAVTINPREQIEFDRPEAWAMKYYTSVTLMTGLGPPRDLHLFSLRVAAEVEWIPYVSDAQRFVGFEGTKQEDMNKLPAIPRLRITLGLWWKLSLTVSYLPPISLFGVEPNLFSISLGRPFAVGRGFTLGALAYGQVGSVEGSFTCSDRDVRGGSDVQQNPFDCTEVSHDHVDMNYFGVEASASYRIRPANNLEPYTSVAVNYMNLGFRVNARYADVIDTTHLATQGTTVSFTWGLLYPITHRLDIGTELFYTPLTVARPQNGGRDTVEGLFNVRGMIAYRFN